MAEYYRILSYLYRYDKKKKMDCKGFIKAEQKTKRTEDHFAD